MNCKDCKNKIPAERLKIIPGTQYCVKCATNHPPPPPDPETVCAKSAPSGQNGWSPKD